jgi:hypothetical protein
MIIFGVVFAHEHLQKRRSMNIRKLIFLVLPAIILIGSCHKIAEISPIPSIKYTSFTIFDTTDILGNDLKGGKLRFHFEDGDGDIGLNEPVSELYDSTDLFFTLYRKIDGVMVPAATNDPLFPSPYRIPYMEPQGQDKVLRGTISVTFMYLFYEPTDTIKYDFYLKDRGNHKSNVASTSEIIISQDNVYTK